MKKLIPIWVTIVILLGYGCTAVPIAKDNTGIKVNDVGFQPQDMGTVKSGRDTATNVSLVGGITGIVAILCLTVVAIASIKRDRQDRMP